MGDDFPHVPVFRIYLVRQWIHARVGQGCCGLACLAGYDAPRAVFFSASWFDSGYMLLPVYWFFDVLFPYSAQCLVLSGPRYAPATEFASSLSLSWCTGRFTWSLRPCRSCRFFQVVCPLCATTGALLTFLSCSSSTRSCTLLSWRRVLSP